MPVSIVMYDRKSSYPYVPSSRVPSVTVKPRLEIVPPSVRLNSFQVKQVPIFFLIQLEKWIMYAGIFMMTFHKAPLFYFLLFPDEEIIVPAGIGPS